MMLAIELSDCIQRSISKAMSSSTNILTFLHRLLDSNIIGLVKYFCYSLKSLFLSRLSEPSRNRLRDLLRNPFKNPFRNPFRNLSETVSEIISETLLKTLSEKPLDTLPKTLFRDSTWGIQKNRISYGSHGVKLLVTFRMHFYTLKLFGTRFPDALRRLLYVFVLREMPYETNCFVLRMLKYNHAKCAWRRICILATEGSTMP